ncbi:birA, biotin-(acetyl-CoA-carboxylase) ligase [Xenococcus sp. PCC 7305]|uniref:biotin--[acetyl-CoA-carboxylase] ligase n=1 Tax=Xenococcus sp. PCC 7305 TaxID=102125 RepID=UPI0002AD133F|nr:biotin--[acetyl-CoA-carboxylase] ligase [Xenococcus sp. PCC 7305]ELS02188.1 birA, biotin-(acetyl-CoA-carboxylase) ligase [Xenococcus sp. PCC 7305]
MSFNLKIYQQELTKLATVYKLNPVDLYVFEIIPSTNQKILSLIDEGKSLPIAAIALQQTSGTGQWGRTWQSSLGGLYLSVAIRPNISLDDSWHLIMATAWGIAKRLRNLNIPVSLKWPNDLILQNRKLGGIKIETRTSKGKIKYAVIGVGINWTNPVPELGINLQSYLQEQERTSITCLEQLTAITIQGILSGYRHYLDNGGCQILANYEKMLTSIGQEVTVNNYLGVVTGVTIQGALKVRLQSPGASTEICLSPGQISLGYPQCDK